MTNPFRRKCRYEPPNPKEPEFSSAGGLEMWRLLMDLRERQAATEARQAILMVLMILAVGATVVKDYF